MSEVTFLEDIETQKCSAGIDGCIYFIRTYCKLRHPLHGKIPFDLFPYQEKALRDFASNRKCVLLKSRQMGFSWLIAAYSLWLASFKDDAEILLMSRKEKDAQELLYKVRFMHDLLPRFLRLKRMADQDSKSILGFRNGSRIQSLPATEQSGRGGAGTLVVIDEAAFIPWGEQVFAALKPTLSTGGSLIIQSTAPDQGGENLFARLWHHYEETGFHKCIGIGEESMEKQMIHWSDNPDRDDKWFEEERPGYTERQWQTEMEGSFEQSTRRVFPEEILKLHNADWKKGDLGELYCEEVDPFEMYAIGFDPAEGLEKGDYSVAQVLRKSDGKQVCIYRSRKPLINASEDVVVLARRWNTAVLAIEDNNVGVVAVNIAKKRYNNLYKRKVIDKKTDRMTEKIGWRSTKRTKPLLVRDLEMALRDREIKLTDKDTRQEMWQYEYDENGATNAPRGQYYDDCVMSLGVAYQALKQLPTPEQFAKRQQLKKNRKTRMLKRVRSSSIGY